METHVTHYPMPSVTTNRQRHSPVGVNRKKHRLTNSEARRDRKLIETETMNFPRPLLVAC